ncbi:DUF192 domain-containing protein [Halopiger djelfimassiliensis]|uniref:DUF192 domain-containing protein n=1 Tax=Halopiger djelfimassiliensis TaxID=1293047 RepID=UPI0009DBBD2C|nr:DUF192 domain-containing protein [Halopiger djelfimassiliensis]
MAFERVWKGLLAGVGLAVLAVVLVQAGLIPVVGSDEGTVRVVDEDDDRDPKATIAVDVADTASERYTGLSDHDSLEDGEGMLFVHSTEAERTYVMREMEFDIDIVFIGADREITSIEHARAPEPGEDGDDLRYTGRAQWVLEVPRGYTNETGIEAGDEVEIDLDSGDGLSLSVASEAAPEAESATASTG